MPKPYQAVIFDMDGLIVDTENFITTPITRRSTNWTLTYRAKVMAAVLDTPWKATFLLKNFLGLPKENYEMRSHR